MLRWVSIVICIAYIGALHTQEKDAQQCGFFATIKQCTQTLRATYAFTNNTITPHNSRQHTRTLHTFLFKNPSTTLQRTDTLLASERHLDCTQKNLLSPAIIRGDKETVRFLLECKATPHSGVRKNNPLYLAVDNNLCDITHLLLMHKADANQEIMCSEDNKKIYPIWFYSVCNEKDVRITRMLIEHGAQITHHFWDKEISTMPGALNDDSPSSYLEHLHNAGVSIATLLASHWETYQPPNQHRHHFQAWLLKQAVVRANEEEQHNDYYLHYYADVGTILKYRFLPGLADIIAQYAVEPPHFHLVCPATEMVRADILNWITALPPIVKLQYQCSITGENITILCNAKALKTLYTTYCKELQKHRT